MKNVLANGISLYNKKDFKAALDFFLNISDEIEASVDNLELSYYVGLCYARLRQYDEALPFLEQIVTSGKDLERVNQCRLALAVIYSKTQRTSMAEFELQKLLESGYKTSQVFCGLAFVAWENSDESTAIDYYERALDLEPENSTALNGLGYVLACMGKDLTRALFLCKRAVDMMPESAAYLDSLGWVYFKLGLFKEAEGFLSRAKEKDSEAVEIAEHYKEVLLNKGLL